MTALCQFCAGDVEQRTTTMDFWWGDELRIIEDVPAGVCRQCGEKYVDATVYASMEALAKGTGNATRHISVEVLRYRTA